MRTKTITLTGELSAQALASHLIHQSQWFAVEPMPDDQWEVTVKVEAAALLPIQ